MRRLGWALALLGLALAHTSDLEVDRVRVLVTPEGSFLELVVSYPIEQSPLALRVVMTDRSRGVFEERVGREYRPVPEIPITFGVNQFSLATPYRIRLVGGEYQPGEEVPVTLLFPAGALLTLPAEVVVERSPPWTLLAAGAALALVLALSTRRLLRSRRPGRAR